VSITIWDDLRFQSLTDDAKLLWLFFLTSSPCPIPGVMIASELVVAEQIGWRPERVRYAFAELVSKGINVAWEGRVLWCRNGFRHQPVAGPNPMKSMATAFLNIPDVSFKHALWVALREATKGWSSAFRDLFPEPKRPVVRTTAPVDVDQVPLPFSGAMAPVLDLHRCTGQVEKDLKRPTDPDLAPGDDPVAKGLRTGSTTGSRYSARTDPEALEIFARLQAGGFRSFPEPSADERKGAMSAQPEDLSRRAADDRQDVQRIAQEWLNQRGEAKEATG
jgi:hypothetical protein